MSQKYSLEASPREIVGKKVKQLRRQGMVPAVVYGRESEPINLTVDHKALRSVLAHAGGTQLIALQVGSQSIPALAREVQRDPIAGNILHVDFYRVAMDRLIRAEVPVVVVGESPVVASREGILIHLTNSVEVEALPADLPPSIQVEASTLTAVGQHILVSDLPVPAGVRIVTDPGELILKIDQPMTAEVEEALFVEPISADAVEVIRERRAEEEEE